MDKTRTPDSLRYSSFSEIEAITDSKSNLIKILKKCIFKLF